MRIMRDLNYTERTGHGVLNIIKNYGKKTITINNDYVIVTLRFDEEVMMSHRIFSEPQNELQSEPQSEPKNIEEKNNFISKRESKNFQN